LGEPLALTLIGRSYCHLCDDLRAALLAAAQADGASIALTDIDVDEHPELEPEYGLLVPVLLIGNPLAAGAGAVKEICHYHFDPEAWRTTLSAHATG
jgi:hypothetical protein